MALKTPPQMRSTAGKRSNRPDPAQGARTANPLLGDKRPMKRERPGNPDPPKHCKGDKAGRGPPKLKAGTAPQGVGPRRGGREGKTPIQGRIGAERHKGPS